MGTFKFGELLLFRTRQNVSVQISYSPFWRVTFRSYSPNEIFTRHGELASAYVEPCLNYILNIESAITVDIPITAGEIWRTTVISQMDIQDQMTVLLSNCPENLKKKFT